MANQHTKKAAAATKAKPEAPAKKTPARKSAARKP